MTLITIPDSVTSIGNSAFSSCKKLTEIKIGNGVTNIGSSAFYDCTGLTSITVSSENTEYHSQGNCLIDTKNKVLIFGFNTSVIPTDGSVTSIGNSAFSGCTGLTSITIPNSVTSIGSSVFYNTAYYNNKSNWVDGVLYIGNYLIKAKNLFSGNYTIKPGTKYIAPYAFSGCKSLTSVTIPNSVTNINRYAFNNCTDLTSITFNGTMAQWNAIAKDSSWDTNTGSYTIHCTDGDIKK